MHLETTTLEAFHPMSDDEAETSRRLSLMSLPSRKVLLIDDAPEMRLILRRILQYEGYVVLEAASGEEALETLRREKDIRLMLLDLVMPDTDGLSILKEIESMPRKPKVCVVSALGDPDVVQCALALDADDYLVKPIVPTDVAHKVNSLLGAPDLAEEAPRLRCDFDATVKYDDTARSASIDWLTEHGVQLTVRTSEAVPDHLRLQCPALWRLIEYFDDGFAGIQLRVSAQLRGQRGLTLRADFVGLPEKARAQLRAATKKGASLSDDALLN